MPTESAALRPPSLANCESCLEEMMQEIDEAEAELDRLGIKRISGGSDAPENPDYQPLDIAWIERKSRFIFIRSYLNELRVLRMTGNRQLITQVVNDLVKLVMEEKDPERIWVAEEVFLLPLREFMENPESTTLYRNVYHGYRKLYGEERRRHRASHQED